MFISFKKRSKEAEIIDDFSLVGSAIEDTYRSIEAVNTWLGGNLVYKNSLKKILKQNSFNNKQKDNIILYDLGCGVGDGLCALAEWAQKKQIKIDFLGLDANPFVIELAKKKALNYSEIKFEEKNIFSESLSLKSVDIVSFNLCLHHFTEEEYLPLLKKCKEAGVRAILINDLHRHWLAYRLFQLLCFMFRIPEIAKKDGLLSIRKGFKSKELIKIADQLKANNYNLAWKWAFRYQFIVYL